MNLEAALAAAIDALAHDPRASSWEHLLEDHLRDGWARRVEEFETVIDRKLPDMCVALGLHFGGIQSMLSPRFVNRWPEKLKYPTSGGGLLSLRDLDHMRDMHHEWMLDRARDNVPEPVQAWVRADLVPFYVIGPHVAFCFDYRFDRENPPVVSIDNGTGWATMPPGKSEGKMWWGADDFEAFLRLPLVPDDPVWDFPECDPPTEREAEWLAWRDDFWHENFGNR